MRDTNAIHFRPRPRHFRKADFRSSLIKRSRVSRCSFAFVGFISLFSLLMCLGCWRVYVLLEVLSTMPWHLPCRPAYEYCMMNFLCVVECDHRDCISLGGRIGKDAGSGRCRLVAETV